MVRRALLLAAVVSLLLAADAPTKDEPAKPVTLSWVGPTGGKWSDPANWKPKQLPRLQDTLVFDGERGSDTASVMDRSYHIAKLEIHRNYTQKITLESDLFVDVLKMEGGTIDGTKRLILWQRVTGQLQPASKLESSFFNGGTIKVNTFTYGEFRHPLTLWLALVPGLTPNLQANLAIDAFTRMKWEANNATVGGGKTIAVYGSFDALSPGRIGNPSADWNLYVMTDGSLSYGKGKYDHAKVQSKGGTIYIEHAEDAIPGGGRIFKPAIGHGRQDDEYAKVELKGVLSEGPFGPEFTVGASVYDLDLSKKPKLKAALRKLYGQKGMIVAGQLYPLTEPHPQVVVSSVHVEVTEDE